MIEYIIKTIFFIIAFTPLWIILFIINFINGPDCWLALVFVGATIASICIFLVYLKSKSNPKSKARNFLVKQKIEITQNAGFYFLAYIPVLLIDNLEPASILTFFVLLSTIYILYIKTNMLYSNPIIILRYHVYQITDEHDNTVILLSRLKIKTGDIQYRKITSDLNIAIDED